jgi:hypothetical protein
MGADGLRRALGDESLVWTRLCGRFREVERDVARHGLEERWRVLLGEVRAGSANAIDGQLFLAEIADLAGYEEDFVGRNGIWPVTTLEDARSAGYGCPGKLCRRREMTSPVEPVPQCGLLAADMTDPIG